MNFDIFITRLQQKCFLPALFHFFGVFSLKYMKLCPEMMYVQKKKKYIISPKNTCVSNRQGLFKNTISTSNKIKQFYC